MEVTSEPVVFDAADLTADPAGRPFCFCWVEPR